MARHWFALLCAAALFPAGRAAAAEVCDLPPRFGLSPAAVAIVHTACNEHRLWWRPFIDSNGRLAGLRVTEAERSYLADHGIEAWQRVAAYWRDSGTLGAMGGSDGATSCQQLDGSRYRQADCRAFLVDNPWSAAFVSWVMVRAGVDGFHASVRHIDYIRAAYQAGSDGLPYRYADPQQDKPAPGDLLCFLRGRKQPLGASGLREALARGGARPWESHCDIVVAANVGGDHTLYLIGGNVLNAVTMRKLPLDRAGRLQLQAPLAQDQVGDDGAGLECTPGREELCDFNRQDWAALLQLQPQAQLRPLALPGVVPAVKPAALPAAAPMAPAPASGTAPAAAPATPVPQPQATEPLPER
ncbi:DUF2272 domain-containing protein [Xanthomonas translucens]|uniref:DUF2272 domain-containing protein n=5 Tax=Xanthomonas campestris pv. translucens TaxID=343 RepID=A0A109HNJ5_XANCT|nr:DUF2272 domain-containing protein [Xanthomonas translucens]KWV13888.1 hypothetical protein ATB53_14785 [Xanthomonas translucens]KWV15281.1 hypothetical protein ATB54_00195 [Xanthomonas translucens]MCC8445654.1 DUF2272 domain-containing protein [Xanthomonas translucens pv. translucens]MCS3359324.1 DUF2272 domain-containing protein [Xanthomonas translucens pv. translucens]MCS3372554.1 DUF2272 domain-containing protein [Xanthomonas translucens pv. translucens]